MKNKLKQHIKRLERKGHISKKPHPILPFVLFFLILLLGAIVFFKDYNEIFSYSLFFLAGFSLIFAIIHLIVVRIVKE